MAVSLRRRKSFILNLIIVGSSSQVTAGLADYSSIQEAIDSASVGSDLQILPGTYSENVSLNKRVNITGLGLESVINGNFSLVSCSGSSVKHLKIVGNLSVDINSNNNFIRECWFGSSSVATDYGASNSILLIQE